MIEAGIGRLLVASLHQAIIDLLPVRLEFYEAWLSPAGLHRGRIGPAQLAAVLSFLRLEGELYSLVAARAGEYTANWTVAGLTAFERAVIRVAPSGLRSRVVMRRARRMIRETSRGSCAIVHRHKGRVSVQIRGSVFCGVRDRVGQPLCGFYASAIRRLMLLFNLEVEVATEQCRATGAEQCVMTVLVRSAGAEG
jgi:hypothetical protein